MINNENYSSVEKELKEIDKNDLKKPLIPISVYLQEAEDLYHIAKADAKKLAVTGLSEDTIDNLSVRVNACRYAQSNWNREQNERQEALKLWKEKSPDAFNLRDELVHTFYFAFRKNEELIQQVRAIDEGTSNADMIQDLSDLALLGDKYIDMLTAVSLKKEILEKASSLAIEMADLLAAANGEKFADDENKLTRDRAYTYLKEAVDEIRDTTGKFVFWKDPEKVRAYSSKYLKRRKSRLNNAKLNEETEITNQELEMKK